MRKSVWMCFAASAALTLSASASVAILSSFRSGTGEDLPIAVSGPEALRRELRAAQAASLPSAVPLTVDAGWRVYTGEEGENAAALAEGLLPAESPDGGTGWPVTVREDPWTRATVFLNAVGDTIGWLPPPEGYDPEWILSETYPGGVPAGIDPGLFDPASVAVTVWLATGRDILPPAAETVPPRTGAGARAAARRPVRGGADTDGDGMPDAWETAHGLDPLDPADAGRDPIGEEGGLNLYGFCGNDGVNLFDYLGMEWLIARNHYYSAKAIKSDSNSDTIASLADKIKLSASEAMQWARKNEVGDKFSSETELSKSCFVYIPNNIKTYLPKEEPIPIGYKEYIPLYNLHMFLKHAVSIGIRDNLLDIAAIYSERGYSVETFDYALMSYNTQNDNGWPLYGIIVGGHGFRSNGCRGMINMDNSIPCSAISFFSKKCYDYRLAVVFGCYAAAGNWQSLASSSADCFISPDRIVGFWEFEKVYQRILLR